MASATVLTTWLDREHVTTTLKNAIEQNRLAHAYLFVRPAGIGKTSTRAFSRRPSTA